MVAFVSSKRVVAHAKLATDIERAFNVAGNIPYVGIVSGSLRAVAGKMQAIAGLAFCIIGVVGTAIAHNSKVKHRYQNLTNLGVQHLRHGILNMIRGIIEVGLGCSFGGFGSVFMLIPNLSQDRAFDPYFKY
jgi:hypothetical protein